MVALWPEPPSRITRENFDRIKVGMNRKEVEAIIGAPGDYRTAVGETDLSTSRGTSWRSDTDFNDRDLGWQEHIDWVEHELFKQAIWVGDTFLFRCRVDDSDRVKEINAFSRRTKQTALDRLLWRAKRQWHRWFPE